MRKFNHSLTSRVAILAVLCAALNTGTFLAQKTVQKTYDSPAAAVTDLVAAIRADDVNRLNTIFGPEAKEIVSSGDPVADKRTRDQFLERYQQMNRLVKDNADSVTLYLGAENWPFPVPIVKKSDAWMFDSVTGEKEILYRRIGRNEFDTIDTLHALVDAQKEYASAVRDGSSTKHFAEKLMSDQGKHNGLYWKPESGEPTSPIGPLIAQASSEGYRKQAGPAPFHGYIYRLLRQQGPAAQGGAMNYIQDGKLVKGFAVIAYPADYRNSGVMTFVVNQNGKVYQKDLGPKTASIASAMNQYNPDTSWKFVE